MAKSVIKRRLYVVSVPPSIPAEKIYTKLAEALRTSYAEIAIRGGKAFIVIVGTDAQIKESWLRVRNVLSQLWGLHMLQTSKEVPIEVVAREAGRTFPPEALVYALRLRGYNAELSDDKQLIYTNAPPDEVVALAKSIAETLDSIKFRVRGAAAKRLVAAISAGLGIEPTKVIEVAMEAGVLIESEDGVRLREEWRRGLRKLALVLRPEAPETRGEVWPRNDKAKAAEAEQQ